MNPADKKRSYSDSEDSGSELSSVAFATSSEGISALISSIFDTSCIDNYLH